MLEDRRVLGVHIENGVVQKITSSNPDIEGTAVVIFDDGDIQRALFADHDDGTLADAAEQAIDSTRCHGIGMACDLAGERLLALGRKKFDGSKEAVEDVVSVIEELREMIGAALALQTVERE